MMRMKTKGWQWTARALWALAAVLAFRLAWNGWGSAPADDSAPARHVAEPESFRWPATDAKLWRLFRSGEPGAPPPAVGALSARYRLAGVFLILTDPGQAGGEDRCAILDDMQTREQVLAAEGETMGPIRVAGVFSDHVVLSDGAHEEMLYLAAGTLPEQGAAGSAAPPAEEAPKILESNRFGNRVGETRWEISRQAVLDYYQEMMDNPERAAALFMAMEADRDLDGKVAGYRLNTEVGEKDFYTQVGLQNGDVVRKVNSMRMTSQRRAEYFIGEFVQNRLGAVVIDIEREGEPKKLIYLVK